MDQRLINKLLKRSEEGTLRSLSHFEGFIDFFSNDYLGLSKLQSNTSVSSYGATGSRLISGTSKEMLDAEVEVADFFKTEAALMFNSGYDANIGFFSSVPQRGDVIFYDSLIHASVRDGIQMSFAKAQSFNHNDCKELEKKLQRVTGVKYVAIESVYSMDGDMAPVREIVKLCKKYDAYLIVDEAHAVGVFGKDGRGVVDALGLVDDVFARLITFGKAYGSHGGCFVGSKQLIDYLTNFARSFIYTTALPSSVYWRNSQILSAEEVNIRRELLQDNLKFFRSTFKDTRLISEVNSPIQILNIGDIKETHSMAARFQEAKIAAKPIFSPTVPEGSERIRLCFHAFNTKEDIKTLVDELSSVG